MASKRSTKECCPMSNPLNRNVFLGGASVLATCTASALAGIGCLGCIPFLGAALAASGFAAFLDNHLLSLQIGLIALSAVFSFFYFRRVGYWRLQVGLAYSAYSTLILNAIYIEKKEVAVALLIVLAVAHLLKKRSTLSLLYFEGCPTYPELKKELDQRGVPYREIDLESLNDGHPLKKYSSPTLLFRDEILFGTALNSASMSCSYASPEDLKTAAEQAFLLSRKS